jgi:hypothetical protein
MSELANAKGIAAAVLSTVAAAITRGGISSIASHARYRGTKFERGLGARPARRHQSLHVRSSVGDDRHRLSKRLMARPSGSPATTRVREPLLGFHVGF